MGDNKKMRIGLIAEQSKRELMQNFCIAYKYLLEKHSLFAPQGTARAVANETNLTIESFLPEEMGGIMQLSGQIERNEIDAVIYFYTPVPMEDSMFDDSNRSFFDCVRLCDEYCIPVATNIAMAEILILGIQNGDLDWRL